MTPSHSGHSSVHGTPATKGEIKINDINVSILSQNSTNISMSTPSGKIVKTVRGMKSNNQTTAINNENWGENRSSSGSNHSDNTQHTSMTEIQERTSSATIIRSNQNNR